MTWRGPWDGPWDGAWEGEGEPSGAYFVSASVAIAGAATVVVDGQVEIEGAATGGSRIMRPWRPLPTSDFVYASVAMRGGAVVRVRGGLAEAPEAVAAEIGERTARALAPAIAAKTRADIAARAQAQAEAKRRREDEELFLLMAA